MCAGPGSLFLAGTTGSATARTSYILFVERNINGELLAAGGCYGPFRGPTTVKRSCTGNRDHNPDASRPEI